MKVLQLFIVLFALHLTLTACTTASQTSSSNTAQPNTVSPNAALQSEEAVVASAYDETITIENEQQNDELEANLSNKDEEAIASILKKNALLIEEITQKNQRIHELQKALIDGQALNGQEYAILLAEEKQLRKELEAENALLVIDNNLLRAKVSDVLGESAQLVARVAELELSVEEQKRTIENYDSDIVALESALDEYGAYLASIENTDSNQLVNIQTRNRQLESELKKTNDELAQVVKGRDRLSIELSDTEQALTLSENKQGLLKSELSNTKQSLLQGEANRDSLNLELSRTKQALLENEETLQALMLELATAKQRLFELEKDSLLLNQLQQLASIQLQNVEWEFPDEVDYEASFDVIVSAEITSPTIAAGLINGTLEAELIVSDSIAMIGNPVIDSVIQNGRVEWRWRLASISEAKIASMNLLIRRALPMRNQTALGLVYRDNESVTLLGEAFAFKYLYWIMALILSLVMGLALSRIIRGGRKD